MQNTIVLTGGGTAGHVMPNIAILPDLIKNFDHICYIGSSNGIEKSIVAKYKKIKYYEIPTAKLVRKLSLKNIAMPFIVIKSIIKCLKILKEIKPKVIFSKGGYVAVPVVIAGAILRIPIIAHESDSTIGLANKIIYRYCKKMFFSFEEAIKGYEKKGVFSGSPIRSEFLKSTPITHLKNLDSNKLTITIVGGSLGSTALNKIIIDTLPNLSQYNIVHIVGKGKLNKTVNSSNYIQLEFIDDIASLYRQSELVISRAGSNAIFELLAMAKPMILIPLPKDESRGDQIVNAKIFEKKGFALYIDQANLTPYVLKEKIKYLINNKSKYINKMRQIKTNTANKTIVEELLKYKHNLTICP